MVVPLLKQHTYDCGIILTCLTNGLPSNISGNNLVPTLRLMEVTCSLFTSVLLATYVPRAKTPDVRIYGSCEQIITLAPSLVTKGAVNIQHKTLQVLTYLIPYSIFHTLFHTLFQWYPI